MQIWSTAKSLAEQTPPERNRYVDFLRAVSILFVITGHWLVATFYFADGEMSAGKLTAIQPGTQWLTWVFQVMPIFFIVGGYANAVSLESARRKGIDYAGWLAGRLNRLVTPLLMLVLFWGAFALILHLAGVSGPNLRFGSRAALIPTWFLAIYIMVVILAPVTYNVWRRWGLASIVGFGAVGVVVDYLYFAHDLTFLGWTNYFWVWLCVHQFGYAWRDDRFGNAPVMLVFSILGFAALWTLIFKGPYPFAMVTSPSGEVSNTAPPKITLIALAICQFGLLMAIEKPMRRFLEGVRAWAATVLINSLIMTVYLWHITVLVLLIGIAWLAGGIGLGIEPATPEWWYTRPIYIGLLYVVLVPVSLALSPLERLGQKAGGPPPAAARQIIGAILLCLGVASLAMYGFGASPLPYLDIVSFALVIVGAGINGLLPKFRR
jgi:peptidoglycan/LPS O-acetylase OafA/YrhL